MAQSNQGASKPSKTKSPTMNLEKQQGERQSQENQEGNLLRGTVACGPDRSMKLSGKDFEITPGKHAFNKGVRKPNPTTKKSWAQDDKRKIDKVLNSECPRTWRWAQPDFFELLT